LNVVSEFTEGISLR